MISLCMIVKNEEDVLEKCINSVKTKLKGIVTDYVIVDTGSSDKTKEIAEKLGCRVFDFEWVDNFSKARNFSISKSKNEWILFLDADEYITDVDVNELKKLCTNKHKDVKGFVKMKNLNSEGFVTATNLLSRVFNKRVYYFKNAIHENLHRIHEGSVANYHLNFTVEHTGYIKEVVDAKGKVDRNKVLINNYLKENPNDLYMIGQLASTHAAGEEDEEALKLFEKVVFDERSAGEVYYNMMVCQYINLLLKLDLNEAAVLCENLWEYCKDSDQYIYYMGVAYLRENHIEKAADAFLTCINKNDECSVDKRLPYKYLGLIFDEIGDFEQALICYKNADNSPEVIDRIEKIEKQMSKN